MGLPAWLSWLSLGVREHFGGATRLAFLALARRPRPFWWGYPLGCLHGLPRRHDGDDDDIDDEKFTWSIVMSSLVTFGTRTVDETTHMIPTFLTPKMIPKHPMHLDDSDFDCS